MDYEMRYLQRRLIRDMPSYVPEAEISIPKEEELLPVVIRIYKENGEVTLDRLRKLLAEYFWMDSDSYYYKLENWKTPLFYYRVYRIVYYLYRHFLLDRTGRGRYRLSELGFQVADYYPYIRIDEVSRIPVRVEVRGLRNYDFEEYPPIYGNEVKVENLIDADIRKFGFPVMK